MGQFDPELVYLMRLCDAILTHIRNSQNRSEIELWETGSFAAPFWCYKQNPIYQFDIFVYYEINLASLLIFIVSSFKAVKA